MHGRAARAEEAATAQLDLGAPVEDVAAAMKEAAANIQEAVADVAAAATAVSDAAVAAAAAAPAPAAQPAAAASAVQQAAAAVQDAALPSIKAADLTAVKVGQRDEACCGEAGGATRQRCGMGTPAMRAVLPPGT